MPHSGSQQPLTFQNRGTSADGVPMSDIPALVSLKDVVRLTSLSRSMVNRYRVEGRFPAAVPLGERRVAFVRAEVDKWVRDKMAARAA